MLTNDTNKREASTEVSRDDLSNGVKDEYGVVYSTDGKRLLKCLDKLTKYTIKEGTEVICDHAFSGQWNLTSVTIPNSVTTIGESAFYECMGLISLTIPDGVAIIERVAFERCIHLISISISNSVIAIGKRAFCHCYDLVKFEVDGSNKYYSSSNDGVLFNKNKSTLVVFPARAPLTSYAIPNSVTTIEEAAFWACDLIKCIEIPSSVTTIGRDAFAGCKLLKEITIPESVTSMGKSAFYECTGLTAVNFNAAACTSADSSSNIIFSLCSNLTTVNIGDNVTIIPSYLCYNCEGLTSITIPNGVTEIGNYTFYGCSGLTSVTIPESVTSIGSDAFGGCYGLTEIAIPNSVTSIGSSAFCGCSGLMEVTIPESVTEIGSSSFSGCEGLTSITIPDSVTTIGDEAFYGCTGLNGELVIPDSVTTIGDYAFSDCNRLTSVAIGNSVITIGSGAFYQCTGMTKVTIGNNVTEIKESAFDGCVSLIVIAIPENFNGIREETLSECKRMNLCGLPKGLEFIRDSAFIYDKNHSEFIKTEITNKYIIEAVKSKYGFTGNTLTREECARVEEIEARDVTGMHDKPLWDLRLFPNLVSLDCSYNGISQLNVSQNHKLKYLNWQGVRGGLPLLDLSQNYALREIHGGQDALRELDLSNNPQIEVIEIYLSSSMRWLNIENCGKLKRIVLYGVLIPFVDLTQCKDLEYLEIHYLNTYTRKDGAYGKGYPRPLIFVSEDFDENIIPQTIRNNKYFCYILIRVRSNSAEMDALNKLKMMKDEIVKIPNDYGHISIANKHYELLEMLEMG